MNNDFEERVILLSEKLGEEQATFLDTFFAENGETIKNNPLPSCISWDEQFTKRKRVPFVAVLTAIVFLLFTGGGLVYYSTYDVQNMGNYGVVETTEQEGIFYQEIDIPTGYIRSSIEETNHSRKVVYAKENDVLIFMESQQEIQIDTEYIHRESRVLYSGYEAFYYEKNGSHIFWSQNGYFYYLYTNDNHIDLVELASSIHKR